MIRGKPKDSLRAGMTLAELLVVIAILGTLVALLLPAVQRVREAAKRLSCQNRLKQIAVALHGYHDVNLMLPPGQDRASFGGADGSLQGVSWLAKILPYIDQEPLYEQTRAALAQDIIPWHNPPHIGLATVIPAYTCPSDWRLSAPQAGTEGIMGAFTSYLGVRGSFSGQENGVLVIGYSVRFQQITDGMSQTLMVGERPPSASLDSGWWYTTHDAAYSHDFVLTAEAAVDPLSNCIPAAVQTPDGTSSIGKFVFGPGQITNQCDMYHFWSLHTGGANFSFADGSVRFLAYSVRPALRALATRNGGEVIDVP